MKEKNSNGIFLGLMYSIRVYSFSNCPNGCAWKPYFNRDEGPLPGVPSHDWEVPNWIRPTIGGRADCLSRDQRHQGGWNSKRSPPARCWRSHHEAPSRRETDPMIFHPTTCGTPDCRCLGQKDRFDCFPTKPLLPDRTRQWLRQWFMWRTGQGIWDGHSDVQAYSTHFRHTAHSNREHTFRHTPRIQISVKQHTNRPTAHISGTQHIQIYSARSDRTQSDIQHIQHTFNSYKDRTTRDWMVDTWSLP